MKLHKLDLLSVNKVDWPLGAGVTIGNFDGLHLGHQQLLSFLNQEAQRLQVPKIILTFDPHPLELLAPQKASPRLYTWETQADILQSFSVDHLVLQNFHNSFATLSADHFLQEFLEKYFKPAFVVVGENFYFGRNRQGDFSLLKNYQEQLGRKAYIVESYRQETEVVSSSLIRQYLKNGDIKKAVQMLGRPYTMTGVVEKSQQLGQSLGFPTANLKWDTLLCPKKGVYFSFAILEGKKWPAITNIGSRPTVSNLSAAIFVETHLLNHSVDLYGQRLTVQPIEFLREERKMPDITALQKQIQEDIDTARKFFNV